MVVWPYRFPTLCPCLSLNSTNLNQPFLLWSSGNLWIFSHTPKGICQGTQDIFAEVLCWMNIQHGQTEQAKEKKQEARKEQNPSVFEFLFQMSLNQQLWALPSSWRSASSVQWVNKVCAGATASLSLVRSFHLKKCLLLFSSFFFLSWHYRGLNGSDELVMVYGGFPVYGLLPSQIQPRSLVSRNC